MGSAIDRDTVRGGSFLGCWLRVDDLDRILVIVHQLLIILLGTQDPQRFGLFVICILLKRKQECSQTEEEMWDVGNVVKWLDARLGKGADEGCRNVPSAIIEHLLWTASGCSLLLRAQFEWREGRWTSSI